MVSISSVILVIYSTTSALFQTRQTAAPDGVNITSVQNSGQGCPIGSLDYFITSDNSVYLNRFKDLHAAIGPHPIPDESTSRACQIMIQVSHPAGYQFRLHQSAISGFARLDSGVVGRVFTTYFVSRNAGNTVSVFIICIYSRIFCSTFYSTVDISGHLEQNYLAIPI